MKKMQEKNNMPRVSEKEKERGGKKNNNFCNSNGKFI